MPVLAFLFLFRFSAFDFVVLSGDSFAEFTKSAVFYYYLLSYYHAFSYYECRVVALLRYYWS